MEPTVWRTGELVVSAFSVLSATLTLPPHPPFSRWGGAEVWVQVDSAIPPLPFTSSGDLQSFCRDLICAFYYPRDKEER